MDIRTKLVFALVAVALGSMLAFGWVMYGAMKDNARRETTQLLSGLADVRKESVEKLIRGWQERVRLIASRTQLRESLAAQNGSPDSVVAARIERILTDAAESVQTVASLAVYDLEGRNVASSGEETDRLLAVVEARADPRLAETVGGDDEVRFQGATFGGDGVPRVGFLTDLNLAGERIGTLYVSLRAESLVELTESHRGLGATGELLIMKPERDGGASTLHAVRHPTGKAPGPLKLLGQDHPGLRALAGQDTLVTDGLIDYRGEPVWAATRHLEETGWGLVVKFDVAEEGADVAAFRKQMINLGLSLAAFAILIGVILAVRFANPIHQLAEAANQIREGKLRARAEVTTQDELGLLARTFNDMADELEERMTLLHEFKTFFDYSLDMMCIAGTDGYFKMTNPAFGRVLGWTQDELLAEPFMSLVHADDAQATWDEIEKLSRGIPTISFVNRFRCKDGSYQSLRWTSRPDPETGLLYAVARLPTGQPDG